MDYDYDIGKAFEAIEDEITVSMMRNLSRHRAEETATGLNWAQWQVEQLKALEDFKARNAKKYPEQFRDINDRIPKLINAQREAGQADQEVAILEAMKQGHKPSAPKMKTAKQVKLDAQFFSTNDRKMNALIKATTDDMKKAETSILRRANDQYRKIIYNAQVYANSGAGTYAKAVDMATKDFLSAGINSIEYKNGSRHTVSDYADMAIRTASKRAYLTGEGEKRKEMGEHLVIMNKRGAPCPKCLPFVGKIMIDDVWSGGSREDGNYPLMSAAINAGLYHPRCQDSHSTYFAGITKVDGTYTKKEVEDIEEENKQEAQEQYAKRLEKKYERLAKYSLDEENVERYETKRDKWHEVAEYEKNVVAKGSKNDIMESDLGVFKQKLRNDVNISREYYNTLKEKFSHGNKTAKHLFAKYASGNTIETSIFEGTAHYNTKTKKIFMHYIADLNNSRGSGATWYHEHGHLIDDALGIISKDKQFKALLNEDIYQYRIEYGKSHGIKTFDKADVAISKELQDMRKHSAVADLIDGLTKGNIKGCAGHVSNYWDNPDNITSEAFAHMFESQFDKVRYNEMKKYFPNALAYFEMKIKEVSE